MRPACPPFVLTYGWSRRTPPVVRSRSQGRPRPMCSFRERGWYWVSTATLKIPELTQLESAKSITRYLPAKGIAASERSAVRTLNAGPSPPARIIAKTSIVVLP